MSATNIIKNLLKTQGMVLMLASSGLLLAGCGGGGGGVSHKSSTQTESTAPSNTGNNLGSSNTGSSSQSSSGSNSSTAQAVKISSQSGNQVVTEGASVQLKVVATGSGTLAYQWYFNGKAIQGAKAATLNLNQTTIANKGSYYCVVSNTSSSATSSTITVNVLQQVAANGQALITWQRPQTRANGTSLPANQIQGYTLYNAESSNGSLYKLMDLERNDSSVIVEDLVAGTHYFAMTTTDTSGQESAMSGRFSVTIR